ncbi:M23 family metallopeptidase [Campylobacter curvus]|uniref:M23 family metallopeptidase n=1 Tax=Campylobacter curvus TaxID=200 RepID=UPI001D14D6A4|nr:M23 family metallopeptidase [Campylobacter curvus]UEB50675.1 M23 family metallopeptidase [Campylobacter curvus]
MTILEDLNTILYASKPTSYQLSQNGIGNDKLSYKLYSRDMSKVALAYKQDNIPKGVYISDNDSDKFIRAFNIIKQRSGVKDNEVVKVVVADNGEIIFPLKIRPLNDIGQPYDWSLATNNISATQSVFGKFRGGGRKHAARDLYTDIRDKESVDLNTFKSDVEIVAIADGEVLDTDDFYYDTHQITILHRTSKYGDFIIRYGEVDKDRKKVAKGDFVRQGDTIGYAGLMMDGSRHPDIVGKDKLVTMLHFEYFTNANLSVDKFRLTNRSNPPFMRRDDLADPLEILMDGYNNSFN